MVPANHARVVLSTATSQAEAQTIARLLVEEQLAPCVNILPAACSIYRWRAAIHEDEESVLLIKTAAPLLPALETRLKELHSAEVPELLVFAPEGGSEDYLLWMDESLRSLRR
jgi:periplasmic divalent cation tolerance protein